MKKVLYVMACGLLTACACDDTQWEEVDVIEVEDTAYIEPAPVVAEPAPVVVEPAPVVVQAEPAYAPTPVYDCPCAAAMPCYQPCGYVPMPAPQPKVTTTKKIITTTTTVEEPCGKPVCEPVVTTHEEIIPMEVSYTAHTQEVTPPAQDLIEVTVEKNPYRSEIVGNKSVSAQANEVAVKYDPEVYDVVATRATNRMLQDSAAIYDNGNKKNIYVKETRLLASDLPSGSHRLRGVTRDIIDGSKTFDVVNNLNNADYILETSADWYVAPNNSTPALQYKLSLYDNNNKKLKEWIEIIRQVQE